MSSPTHPVWRGDGGNGGLWGRCNECSDRTFSSCTRSWPRVFMATSPSSRGAQAYRLPLQGADGLQRRAHLLHYQLAGPALCAVDAEAQAALAQAGEEVRSVSDALSFGKMFSGALGADLAAAAAGAQCSPRVPRRRPGRRRFPPREIRMMVSRRGPERRRQQRGARRQERSAGRAAPRHARTGGHGDTVERIAPGLTPLRARGDGADCIGTCVAVCLSLQLLISMRTNRCFVFAFVRARGALRARAAAGLLRPAATDRASTRSPSRQNDPANVTYVYTRTHTIYLHTLL